jgi:hypothetical protein
MSEREKNIMCARMYLHEAAHTKHRSWAFTLLGFAANCRLRAMPEKAAGQLELFA